MSRVTRVDVGSEKSDSFWADRELNLPSQMFALEKKNKGGADWAES